MTGQEAFEQAMGLLGYANGNGLRNDNALLQRALPILNAVYGDLYYVSEKKNPYKPIVSIAEEVPLPERVTNDCFVYGVAMWLAQSENDGDNQQLFASIYNQKRAGASHWGRRIDIFEGGCL